MARIQEAHPTGEYVSPHYGAVPTAEEWASMSPSAREYLEDKYGITGPRAETQEAPEPSVEAREAAVAALGSAFHENWRQTRKQEDGSFEPRVKETKDKAWIEAHGTNQVDIANTEYEDLPEDWQAENKAAAEVVVGIIHEANGQVDLSDEETRTSVGNQVHDAWMSRNDWAKGGELDKPFQDLPADEQAKDIEQVEVGLHVLSN